MLDEKELVGLTQQQRAEAERKAEIKRRALFQIQEDRIDIHESMRSELTGNDRADGRGGNKVTTQKQKAAHESKQDSECSSVFRYIFIAASVKAMMENAIEVAKMVGESLSRVNAPVPATTDSLYYYDTAAVSQPTAEILNSESKLITELVDELKVEEAKATQDLHKIARMTMELEDLTNYYQMRLHPKTGLYVHLVDMIEQVEKIQNPNGHLKYEGTVCFYCPLENVGNLRGMKIVVTDVWGNDDPAEVALSQQNIADSIAQAPAPALHLT